MTTNTLTHPNKRIADQQTEFLKTCLPEEKENFEINFAIQNAMVHYHMLGVKLKPTENDFKDWLGTLEDQEKMLYAHFSIEQAYRVNKFIVFFLERKGVSLYDFLYKNVPAEMMYKWENDMLADGVYSS